MSDYTTAETRQVFRCAECKRKDEEIARLTAALENWEKDFILYRKMLGDKTSQFLALQSATRRLVEAGRSLEVGLSDFWVTTEEGQALFHEWKASLADPVIGGLRKEANHERIALSGVQRTRCKGNRSSRR